MGGCTFLEDIYGWVWLFRTHFWVGVAVYSTFMGGCGWVCKMVKPKEKWLS